MKIFFDLSSSRNVTTRGGVENSRLEAMAHDTKKTEAKDSPFEDSFSRGQTLSRPRKGMLEAKAKDQGHRRKCSPKKRSSKEFFRRFPKKKSSKNFFLAIYKILTIQKIVLSSSRGQGNFRGLDVSRPRQRTSKCVLEDSGYNRLHGS